MPHLKGVIKTPTGEPLGGVTITLTSLYNRADILKGVFSHVTTHRGEYGFPVLPGVYSIRLTRGEQRISDIGVIRIYEDSKDGSLNDFLGVTDTNLRPEALKKFEELKQQAQLSAESASRSEQDAKSHADNAAGSAQQTAQDVTATNAARDDAESAARTAREFVENPLIIVPDAAALPESPHGLYLVENDESKGGGPQIYFYPGDGRRFWFASVEDTQ